ncbi:hypothetical protein NKH34_25030 [Mesorhizobium sp. M1148]|uniref:hypothetical protein n=1 Tax=unclassified Mesorhizobium TaxID=325217 RepID=UPI003337C4A1
MTESEFTIPNDLNPTLIDLEAKAVPLGAERTALLAEDLQIARAPDPDAATTDGGAAARAAAILGRAAPKPTGSGKERRKQIAERVRDLDHALAVLRREIDTERSRTSSLLRERAMPVYRKYVADFAAAMISAHTAQISILGLSDQIQRAGYNSGDIGNHIPGWLGNTVGANSNIASALRDFVAAGLMPARDIPKELRPK